MVEFWLFLCFSFYPIADDRGCQRADRAWPSGRGEVETLQPGAGAPQQGRPACRTVPSSLPQGPLRPLHHVPNGIFGRAPFPDVYWRFNWSFKG